MNAFGSIRGFLKLMAAPFSPWSRSVLAFAILAFLIGRIWLCHVIAAPPHVDDRTWVDRSLKPLWSEDDYHLRDYYAVHHPAFARIVYGAVLHACGIHECDRPLAIYAMDSERWLEIISATGARRPLRTPLRHTLVQFARGKKGPEYNLLRGAYAPLEIATALRLVNIAFLAGMIAFVYAGFKFIFRNRAAALAGCLPIIFCGPIGTGPGDYTGVAAYIGTDSMLLFWLTAFWYLWLRIGVGGIRKAALLGVIAGLMVSTKVNGAFALAGACAYMLFASRGARRLLAPAAACATAFGVFLIINPVYRAGGVSWAAARFKDLFELMFRLRELTAEQEWAGFSRWQILSYTLPYWYFYLPAAAVILRPRRARRLKITAAWAAPVILFNWFLIYVPFPRYAGPMAVAFLVLFGLAAIDLVLTTLEDTHTTGLSEAGAGGG